jgi:proteasome accessory factor C
LDVVGNTWYLRGFCHLRDSMRTFRTDRMRNVLVLPKPVTTRSIPHLCPTRSSMPRQWTPASR